MVISRVRNERARWNELVAQVDDDRMLQPATGGGWSVAHVIWYEREMVGMLRSRALVGNTFEHYPAHSPALRGLIAAKEGEHTPCIESGKKNSTE
jgi:hypothetical protein